MPLRTEMRKVEIRRIPLRYPLKPPLPAFSLWFSPPPAKSRWQSLFLPEMAAGAPTQLADLWAPHPHGYQISLLRASLCSQHSPLCKDLQWLIQACSMAFQPSSFSLCIPRGGPQCSPHKMQVRTICSPVAERKKNGCKWYFFSILRFSL